ncbi:MAG: AmmeMemoRadiSam system radical SAM enzyme [Deltaproteobacteria bacterium]
MGIKAEIKFYNECNGFIICNLCSHFCRLKEGKSGVCEVNMNKNGSLFNKVYGFPAALNIDPVEKKPLYHFLPGSKTFSLGTFGCNMQCPFCQNWHISQYKNQEFKSEFISPEKIVSMALKHNCKSISYTYNEPTVFYPYARDIAILAKEKNILNVFVTNGIASKEVIEDMSGLIDACNVDLKSSEKNFYTKLLRAPFSVLESLKLMKKKKIWLEITTLIVPGENDHPEILNKIADFISNELGKETPWHICAFHPDFKMLEKTRTPVNSLITARQIGEKAGLKHIYIGNTNIENPTYCPECNTLLIERKGYNVNVLWSETGICTKCFYNLKGIW